MKEIKKQVEKILFGYTDMQREVKVLLHELAQFKPTVLSERVTDLTFAQSKREYVDASGYSDKTAKIAIDHFDSQINGEYHALKTLVGNMQIELNRIDYYLTLLPAQEASIIKAFYFQGMTLRQMAETIHCSLRSVERLKAKGFATLVRFYSMLEKLDMRTLGIRAEMRFISYLHEERFAKCLELAKRELPSGIKAMLYILTGCNELWNTGVEKFFDFDACEVIRQSGAKDALKEDVKLLLELAFHLPTGLDRENLVLTLRHFFRDLEYVHLEIAIEAFKLAIFPK